MEVWRVPRLRRLGRPPEEVPRRRRRRRRRWRRWRRRRRVRWRRRRAQVGVAAGRGVPPLDEERRRRRRRVMCALEDVEVVLVAEARARGEVRRRRAEELARVHRRAPAAGHRPRDEEAVAVDVLLAERLALADRLVAVDVVLRRARDLQWLVRGCGLPHRAPAAEDERVSWPAVDRRARAGEAVAVVLASQGLLHRGEVLLVVLLARCAVEDGLDGFSDPHEIQGRAESKPSLQSSAVRLCLWLCCVYRAPTGRGSEEEVGDEPPCVSLLVCV